VEAGRREGGGELVVAARRDFPSKRKDDGDASDERVEFRSTAPIPIRLRWTGRISSGQQHFSQLFCWGTWREPADQGFVTHSHTTYTAVNVTLVAHCTLPIGMVPIDCGCGFS
jgi:hypothetical protein